MVIRERKVFRLSSSWPRLIRLWSCRRHQHIWASSHSLGHYARASGLVALTCSFIFIGGFQKLREGEKFAFVEQLHNEPRHNFSKFAQQLRTFVWAKDTCTAASLTAGGRPFDRPLGKRLRRSRMHSAQIMGPSSNNDDNRALYMHSDCLLGCSLDFMRVALLWLARSLYALHVEEEEFFSLSL